MTEIGKHAPGLRGFPTPDIPAGGSSYLLFYFPSPEWAQYVLGATQLLAEHWNWYKAGTLEPDEAAYEWHCIVEQAPLNLIDTCALPGGGPVERLNESGEVEELIDGAWQEPQGSYAIPPPEARTEPTPDERRCAAAANAANVIKLMYEEVTDAYQNNLSEALAIVQLATAVITLIAPPVGLTLSALANIALAVWASAYAAAEFVTSDFWDSDFDDNMKCALLRCAFEDSGVVTFNFQCVQQELLNQIEWIDPSLGSYALAGQVRWLLTQIGAQGLNLAGATTAITDADCSDCDDTWCWLYLPASGLGSQWEAATPTCNGCAAQGVFDGTTWNATSSCDVADNCTKGVSIRLAKEMRITHIEVNYDRLVGDYDFSNLAYWVEVDPYEYTDVLTSGGSPGAGGTDLNLTWDGDRTIDGLQVNIRSSLKVGGATPNGEVTINSVLLRGRGEPPEGSSNCE